MKWNYLRMIEILQKAMVINDREINVPYYEYTQKEMEIRNLKIRDCSISLPRRFYAYLEKVNKRENQNMKTV